MDLQVKGKVIKITDDKVVNEKLTTKQVVVEWFKDIKDKSYARTTAFDLKRTEKFDSIKKLNGIQEGDMVTVKFNEPESREYNGRYFTSVEPWGIFREEGGNGGGASNNSGDSSDLPF